MHPRDIVAMVAEAYEVTPELLTSPAQHQQACWPRHVAGWLLSRHCELSPAEAGKWLGGRDGTSIRNGIERVERRLPLEEGLRTILAAFQTRIDLAAGRLRPDVSAAPALAAAVAQSRRAAIGLTLDQIQMLAGAFTRAWEVAQAGEALAQAALAGGGQEEAIAAVAEAVIDEMTELRGHSGMVRQAHHEEMT